MRIDPTDRKALRRCAALCWQHRKELQLSDADIAQVLLAWMTVGTSDEGTAASALLGALREAEEKQARFDDLLGGSEGGV